MSGGAPTGDPLERRLVAELPYLRGLLGRLMGTPASGVDREDVVQEVVSRALRYRASFDRRRALRPWLRTTALRVLLDHREGRRRAPVPLTALENEPAAPASSSVDVEDSVAALLRPLATVERDVLLRFHRDGASVREIATALSLPEGTVKSHLHRARRKLAAHTDPEDAS